MATFRQLQIDQPEMSADELDILSEVTEDDDGRWIWIAIGFSLKYAVEKRTGLIFKVEDLRINKSRCYGELRLWDLNWPGFVPA
jgi:hypothetical protein